MRLQCKPTNGNKRCFQRRTQLRLLAHACMGPMRHLLAPSRTAVAMRALELASSLFAHAVSGGADVATLGEADLGLAAHVERELSAPGALEAVRVLCRSCAPARVLCR